MRELVRRLLDSWRCHRGRHEWKAFAHIAISYYDRPAELFPQRRCIRCGIEHPHNAQISHPFFGDLRKEIANDCSDTDQR